MADIEGLEGLLEDFEKLSLTRSEKAAIVDAGAQRIRASLVATTPIDNNREPSRQGVKPHLKTQTTFKENEYADGSTNVGYTVDGYYNRFVNDGHYSTYGRTFTTLKSGKKRMYRPKDLEYGTKYLKGQHFLEQALAESQESAKSAMATKLGEILDHKGVM
ncbi:hypothetical protein N6G95_09415 [Pediococcus inopinatus]|uniref:HK97-gp10 family putative phage morphogenesis protein n=1 Tax=Pediococcus inopinatus TaxID=114090 RepID=UPI002B260040|nr:HK97-gp10 family putative phage morphogenesis protein [Pediococcus inopinatus]WPC19423.1 hypothetical protein N6G95_09415 [Pediococcus inopinatus]